MLPLLAPLLFALFGIAALVVDGGLALSEQARLEAGAERLALEWNRARALSSSARPDACRDTAIGSNASEDCLRRALLRPLAEELGVEDVDALVAGDGQGGFQARGRTPLLFGWGALMPQTARGEAFELSELRAARERDPLGARLSGSGLRAAGFAPESRAIPTAGSTLALRVGPVIADRPDLAGAIGVAWRLDALADLAFEAAHPTGELAIDLVAATADPARRVRRSGIEVGCVFDPGANVLDVGDALPPASASPTALPLALPLPLAVGYLPIVEDCERPVLGFVVVSVTGSATSGPGSIALQTSNGRASERNASALPGDSISEEGFALVSSSDELARFVDPDAPWSTFVLRLPHVAVVGGETAHGSTAGGSG